MPRDLFEKPQGRDLFAAGEVADVPTPESTRSTGGAALPALQGLTLGFGDEGMAAVMAAIATGLPQSMGGASDELSYDENYQGLLEGMREDAKQYKEDNPVKSALAEIGGGIITGGAGFAKAGIKEGAKLGERVARGGGVGAAEAAVYGAGSAEEGGRVEGAIEAAPYGFAGGAAAGEVVEQASKYFKNQSEAKAKIVEMIQQGSGDKDTAIYELSSKIKNGLPAIQKDKEAVEAIKQGFDEGVIAAVKASSPADKKKMRAMANISERGKNNARFGVKNRPSDVAGDALLERFKVVKKANKSAGQKVEREANKLKASGDLVDYSPAVNSFIGDLEGMGVSLGNDFNLNFSGSDIEGVDPAINIINKVADRMKKGGEVKAYDVHRMKKFIDENVSYGKAGEGLTGKTERILKSLRRNLDQVLDSNFDGYKKANDSYSETIGAIDSLQDVAGKKVNLMSENSDKAMGTVLRRVMSNAQSRVNLLDSIEGIESVSKKYGGKHDDDVLNLILFADELDSQFKPVARTSLAGETGKALKQGAEGVRRGPSDIAVDVLAATANKARGINQEGAYKAIKSVLNK